MLLELERLYNHLHDIGAICAGVGYAPGTMAFAALKDRAQQINMRAFGHRFLFGTVRVGAGAAQLDATHADAALRRAARAAASTAAAAWRELEFTGSLQARLDGIGVLGADDARRLGAVGPAARAAGIREDARSTSPRLAYDGFTPASLRAPTGDVASRLRLRAIELETTYEHARGAARETTRQRRNDQRRARPRPSASDASRARAAPPSAPSSSTARRVARLHLRTGSYANWPALAHATAGNLLPDFPLINKSFELCYACVDR